jgi:hypothetical protein
MLEAPHTPALQLATPVLLPITPTTAEANADADFKDSHQSGYHSAKGRDGAPIIAEANADATLLTQSVASGPDLLTQSVATQVPMLLVCRVPDSKLDGTPATPQQ